MYYPMTGLCVLKLCGQSQCSPLQDEKFDLSGPSIDELVGKENVDNLDYMGWLIDQGVDPKQVIGLRNCE